jgi:hypothetical protein
VSGCTVWGMEGWVSKEKGRYFLPHSHCGKSFPDTIASKQKNLLLMAVVSICLWATILDFQTASVRLICFFHLNTNLRL